VKQIATILNKHPYGASFPETVPYNGYGANNVLVEESMKNRAERVGCLFFFNLTNGRRKCKTY